MIKLKTNTSRYRLDGDSSNDKHKSNDRELVTVIIDKGG